MKLILFLTIALGISGPVAAASPPKLEDGGEALVEHFGPTKSVETALGRAHVWRKGDFVVTLVVGPDGTETISFEKAADHGDLNRREAFALAKRFCGAETWRLLSREDGREIYASGDRSAQMTFTSKGGSGSTVTLTHYGVSEGISDL